MKTSLHARFLGTRAGARAEAILGKCVHCGFCLATCPTYQLLGDERDSPRGRIYLIKEALETGQATRRTQQHLDRCLTCRNCESTCPSGVEYGELLEIGRDVVDGAVPRPPAQALLRWALREGLTSKAFAPAVRLGEALRAALPHSLREKLPATRRAQAPLAAAPAGRSVLLLAGCVQPVLAPGIDAATVRVLAAAGIGTVVAGSAGCCGALRAHTGDHPGALADMRRNIDAWWPYLHGPLAAEALVVNASGCGVTVKEYGRQLAHDPLYSDKAARISALTRDLGEYLAPFADALRALLHPGPAGLAVHTPCTLQHGQGLPQTIDVLLRALGFAVLGPAPEAHLCCGSAGAYSILEPELAGQLRTRKLEHLEATGAQCIVSANIGCIQHLGARSRLPVLHWVEAVERALPRPNENHSYSTK